MIKERKWKNQNARLVWRRGDDRPLNIVLASFVFKRRFVERKFSPEKGKLCERKFASCEDERARGEIEV
jgi:hypothetical protein